MFLHFWSGPEPVQLSMWRPLGRSALKPYSLTSTSHRFESVYLWNWQKKKRRTRLLVILLYCLFFPLPLPLSFFRCYFLTHKCHTLEHTHGIKWGRDREQGDGTEAEAEDWVLFRVARFVYLRSLGQVGIWIIPEFLPGTNHSHSLNHSTNL